MSYSTFDQSIRMVCSGIAPCTRTKSKSAKQSPRRGLMSWLHFAKNPSSKHKKQHTAFLVSGQSSLITSATPPSASFSQSNHRAEICHCIEPFMTAVCRSQAETLSREIEAERTAAKEMESEYKTMVKSTTVSVCRRSSWVDLLLCRMRSPRVPP